MSNLTINELIEVDILRMYLLTQPFVPKRTQWQLVHEAMKPIYAPFDGLSTTSNSVQGFKNKCPLKASQMAKLLPKRNNK